MKKRTLLTMLATALGVLLLTIVALGQGAYDAGWHTVGGGGVSTGTTFTVRGTAGQIDAGASSGLIYTVRGGFCGGVLVEYRVYLPLLLRDHQVANSGAGVRH